MTPGTDKFPLKPTSKHDLNQMEDLKTQVHRGRVQDKPQGGGAAATPAASHGLASRPPGFCKKGGAAESTEHLLEVSSNLGVRRS